ncbi:MAG TPA: acyl-CoA reductase [Longimicrobiales bacterium]|nr:acyl-CoA reductase [Longimicrobiales bacterium]
MQRIAAHHLPLDCAGGIEQVVAESGRVRAVVPAMDAATIDRVCTRLLAARVELAAMPVSRVVRSIDTAARRLLDPAEPERGQVLESLRDISGFSDAMAAHVLDRVVTDWLAPQLEQLVHVELGGADAVESFTRTAGGRRVRAVAPPLGLHVFSGNVPGVGVTSIVRALLVRSAVLGKSAATEPSLAPAFARLLAEVDPELGSCVAITYWRGGDRAIEDAALARVGLVVQYGAAEAVAALRARAPAHVHFVEHGPRISFAVIAAADDRNVHAAAGNLARAVALFDQQGCVSPQLAYVIGTAETARVFARAAADALGDLQVELPRGRISAAEAVAIRDLRTSAEFGAIAGRGGELWAGHDLSYSVILSADPTFQGSCLNRTLLVKHVPDLVDVLRAIAPVGHLLQTVGLSGFPPEKLTAVAASLADAGARRITTVADMPWPSPGWHHDGRGPLRELVQWCDLDPDLASLCG